MRRLLPYEQALIDTLGITEEDYFRFIAYQEQYKDIKDGTVLDIRNGLEVGTVALILSIVGTVASVGAALLAPRPDIPRLPDQKARAGVGRRERRYSPRFGFDSIQDLAQYGDPVNLVYTDVTTNPNGGVRVASALLWSAVHSYGGKQYMQMLATIGSSDIIEIAADRTAFGQVPLRQFVNAGNWLYFRNGGPVVFNNLLRGDTFDPSRSGRSGGDLAYRPYIVPPNSFDGFSQAFSPSSFSSFGITSPIPVYVDLFERRDDGKPVRGPNRIKMNKRGVYWPDFYGSSRVPFPVGHQVELDIAKVNGKGDLAEKAAEEERLVAASSIDTASVYKLGSAKFTVVGMSGSEDLNNQELKVTLQCTESGFGPEEDYETESTKEEEDELSALLPQLIAERDALKDELNPTIFVENLSELQRQAYGKLQQKVDELDDLIEDIQFYRRVNKSERKELDEFVLTNEYLFSDGAENLAAKINAQENRLEELREDITEIRKSDEKDAVKGRKIDKKRNAIRGVKEVLRVDRRKLTRLIEQDMFSDQKLFNYLNKIEEVAAFAESQFSTIAGFQVTNPDKLDFSSLLSDRRNFGQLGAKAEKKVLKKVRGRLYQIQARIASILQVDQAAIDAHNANINNQINEINKRIQRIKETLEKPQGLNDFLVTKCLTKIQEASYETVSACKVVNFAIKGRAFMRVQGRQKQYGDVTVNGYRQSDNGLKHRSAFFLMFVRENTNTTWSLVPCIFVLSRAADNDFFFPLYFEAPDSSKRWAFRFEPVFDTSSEMRKHGPLRFTYVSGGQTVENIKTVTIPGGLGSVKFYGTTKDADSGNLAPRNRSPFAIDEWCLYPPSLITDNDTSEGVTKVIKACSSDANIAFSFDNGPEFEITAVTEQQYEPNFSAEFANAYQDLTLLGFNCFSGQGIRSLRSLSAFVTKGKKVRRLDQDAGSYPSSPDGPSNFASDIFLDTVLDKKNGIGQYANVAGIDLQKLALSKKMNQAMGYYMDGVIADISSWREFWAETASYCLLELARIGGRDTLIPALPTNSTGQINGVVTISALFNQGNILEDSYKEDFIDYGDSTQDLVATVIYRAPEFSGVFPKNTSVTINLADVNDNDARRVTFDLSQFVTSRTQAIHYGMLMCMQRRYVRRAVEFQTFPTEAPVQPGSYIYVQTDENQWDNIKSGVVESGGGLNAPLTDSVTNGTFNVLLYDGSSTVQSLSSVSVSNGRAPSLAAYEGWLFVLGTALRSKRVFRVTEVELAEEGEITVRAIEHPCEESGGQARSLIARQDASLFKIVG